MHTIALFLAICVSIITCAYTTTQEPKTPLTRKLKKTKPQKRTDLKAYVRSTMQTPKPGGLRKPAKITAPKKTFLNGSPYLPKVMRPKMTRYYQKVVRFYKHHSGCLLGEKFPRANKDELLRIDEDYINAERAYMERQTTILAEKIKQSRETPDVVHIIQLNHAKDLPRAFSKLIMTRT